MRSNLLIYGVTGSLGGLVSRLAAAAGLPHLAAGRDLERVTVHADRLLLPGRTFSLGDPAKVDRALADVAVVLNAAAPCGDTAPPLIEACLRGGVHYLDLASQVSDLEATRRLDARGREAGVMLMAGLGFGMVPADALAARLKRRLPTGEHLRLAFEVVGRPPRGFRLDLLRGLDRPGFRRRDEELVGAGWAEETRNVDLGGGPRRAATDPWRGELVTAYWSSVYSDIDTYTVYSAPQRWLSRVARPLWLRRLAAGTVAPGLLRLAPWGRALHTLVRSAEPDDEDDESFRGRSTRIWANAQDAAGNQASGRLHGPEASLLTARIALWAVQRVLAGRVRSGFQTAVTAWGPDIVDRLVEEVEGIEVQWS